MPVDPRALLLDLLHRPGEVLARHGRHVPELAAMRGCPQPANHHAEGDVWTHTALALSVLADLPAAVARHAGAALAAADVEVALPARTLTQAVTVLLHDVGKPVTIAGPAGAWTYYDHDRVGARIARRLLERLDLPRVAVQLGEELDAEAVCWAVREHLFWLNTDVAQVTDRAVAKRFVREDGRDELLRVLAWCDTLGSRGPDGRPYVELLVAAEARLAATRERLAAAAHRRPPLLDGRAVMQALDVPPSPRVGAVLAWLRARTDDEGEGRRLLSERRRWLRDVPLTSLRDDGGEP